MIINCSHSVENVLIQLPVLSWLSVSLRTAPASWTYVMICPASPLTPLCCCYSGGISCHVRVQAAGIACRSARTWEEPPVNPPSARHGTFAEQGPPTLKACSREQTQHRDLPCTGLTILGDRRAARRGGGTQTHTHTHEAGSPVSVTPGHVLISPVHEGEVSLSPLRCAQQDAVQISFAPSACFF